MRQKFVANSWKLDGLVPARQELAQEELVIVQSEKGWV